MAITQLKNYRSLTIESAIGLAKDLSLFDPSELLTCEEIGDGNLNYVFRIVSSETGKSIIIKQALPYAKVVGESWPLTLDRARIEAQALKLQRSLAERLVPEVYHSDEELAITVMEDLSHLEIARKGLNKGEIYPALSKDIGEFLGATLFFTSDYALHPFKKKGYVKEFSNPELCKITEDLVFTDPFFNSETNEFEEALEEEVRNLWDDLALKLEVAKLKRSFLTEGEALLHGDLHTGSIFASAQKTKVIDPEFAFYGPIGFDIGQFLANLIFQAIVREETSKKNEILLHIETTWKVFESTFSHFWDQSEDAYTKIDGYLEYVLEKSFTDAIGFLGCELIRRTIGLAHVEDLDSVQDEGKRVLYKKRCLALGRECILERQRIRTIQDLLDKLI
ncbi:S-methyl-5-thioribose kinase [Rossellomorea sp. FS2]|uniref:S-methyl-5-thioribose kinase n=1 Tax=Rossellomorea sp. FS2 TaxID=3391447 RepID=UPI003A4DB79A